MPRDKRRGKADRRPRPPDLQTLGFDEWVGNRPSADLTPTSQSWLRKVIVYAQCTRLSLAKPCWLRNARPMEHAVGLFVMLDDVVSIHYLFWTDC